MEGDWAIAQEYDYDNNYYEEPAYEEPEDLEVFLEGWETQRLTTSVADWTESSRSIWPSCDFLVQLRRMDIYEFVEPYSQQGTLNITESRRIRKSDGWAPVRSLFFLNNNTITSKELIIESAGPPRRHRFRFKDKPNRRDLSDWVQKEKVFALTDPAGHPGTKPHAIDWSDTPDRYRIGLESEDPAIGWRRMFRFAAYPVTQYYILVCNITHEVLDAEGGTGLTYIITAGLYCYLKKGWKLAGSFYGFDHPLKGSNEYTVYQRLDPFPRMNIAMGPMVRPDEWQKPEPLHFYAFDVPVAGTCCYTLQHCLRSIKSTAAGVSRHRLTTLDSRFPWEFRYFMYVFPAEIPDICFCTVDPNPIYPDEEETHAYDGGEYEGNVEGYESVDVGGVSQLEGSTDSTLYY